MKTIVRKGTNLSLYLVADDVPVVMDAEMAQIGNPVDMYVFDCTTDTAVLHENVSNPDDWRGGKYLYDAGAWTLNPNWVDPTQPVQE